MAKKHKFPISEATKLKNIMERNSHVLAIDNFDAFKNKAAFFEKFKDEFPKTKKLILVSRSLNLLRHKSPDPNATLDDIVAEFNTALAAPFQKLKDGGVGKVNYASLPFGRITADKILPALESAMELENFAQVLGVKPLKRLKRLA